jgi:hypothetical protein
LAALACLLLIILPAATPAMAGAAPARAEQSVQVENFNKTQALFLLRVGLAFGAFHRWIYKPFRAGDFSDPRHHKGEVAKAVLAAVFVYHEVKVALEGAKGDKTLSKLAAPLTALRATMSGLGSKIKSGKAATAIGQAKTHVDNTTSVAAKNGVTIKDRNVPAKALGG